MSGLTTPCSISNCSTIVKPTAYRLLKLTHACAGQFADIMELVHGTNTYDILFALAVADEPPCVPAGGRYQFAASFALRYFGDALVRRAPAPDKIARVLREYPVTF